MNLFDLYIANPITSAAVNNWRLPFDINLLTKRGLVPLGMSLDELGEVSKSGLEHGANIYLIPIKYRNPLVTLEDARRIAEKAYCEYLAAGYMLGPLDAGRDEMTAWWSFSAECLDAEEKDLYPGRINISVDKLDGRVRTEKDLHDFFKYSAR